MSSDGETVTREGLLSARVNLYYDLRAAAQPSAPLLIALHGYGANKKQMMREAQQMAPDGFAIVSLQGFHQHLKQPKRTRSSITFRLWLGFIILMRKLVRVHHQALLDLIQKLTDDKTWIESEYFCSAFPKPARAISLCLHIS